MAVFCRKGSQLVKRYRLEKERKKAQQKHWELAGSRLGDVLGIKHKEDDKVSRYRNLFFLHLSSSRTMPKNKMALLTTSLVSSSQITYRARVKQ